MATIPIALSVEVHRRLGTWTNHVDAHVALSNFQKELMVEAGLPAARVHVKPNFFPATPEVMPWRERGSYAIFAGRLTPEKGIDDLITAWRSWGKVAPELRIAGDGPLRQRLEKMSGDSPVRFLGPLEAKAAHAQIAGARLLVLPSVCLEGFPMVLREAFAFGTPVAVSRLGPLPSIVKEGVSGLVFEPGNSSSLLKNVRDAWNSPDFLERLSIGARESFESHYTARANYDALIQIYEKAIAAHNRRPPG